MKELCRSAALVFFLAAVACSIPITSLLMSNVINYDN
uniref:Uncharacterized protein n=1 Tax=Rhizophora mucronata TaxID=61149 RepID=A0A2P2NMG5_RHIMU